MFKIFRRISANFEYSVNYDNFFPSETCKMMTIIIIITIIVIITSCTGTMWLATLEQQKHQQQQQQQLNQYTGVKCIVKQVFDFSTKEFWING